MSGSPLAPIVAGIFAAGVGGLGAAVGVLGWIAGAAALITLVYGLTPLGGTIRLELAVAK